MKIMTITDDKLEYNLLKSNKANAVFDKPVHSEAKERIANYLLAARALNPDETFLILCNNFDGTTLGTLCKLLETLGLAEQTLILFDINQNEVRTLASVNKNKSLGFFRAVYENSYWNLVGKVRLGA